MQTTLVSTLYKTPPQDGCVITVQGWVKTLRDSKAFGFIELGCECIQDVFGLRLLQLKLAKFGFAFFRYGDLVQ